MVESGIGTSVNGLMRAVESLVQVVTDGGRSRYVSELLYGNKSVCLHRSWVASQVFPVPECRGGFFVVWRKICIFYHCDGVDAIVILQYNNFEK